MLKDPSMLFVNWGTPDKEYTLRAAQEKGLESYLASFDVHPDWVSSYIPKSRHIVTNTYDSDVLITDITKFCKQTGITFNGITTFFEMNVVQTADLAAAFNTPFVSPVAARKSSANKALMRLWCERKGIPTPKYAIFSSLDEGLRYLKNFKSPVVIKAVRSGHSYGVMKVEGKTQKQLSDNFAYTHSLARKQLDGNFDEWMPYYDQYKKYFIIEKFIDGKVISIDGIKQSGKIIFSAVTEYEITPGPYLLQNATIIPSGLSFSQQQLCKSSAFRIMDALGFDTCGFHIEMKLSDKGPILLEAAARLPGGNIIETYKQIYGVNLAHMFLDLCLGKRLQPKETKPKQFALIESKFTMKSGIISYTKRGSANVPNATILHLHASGQHVKPTLGFPTMYLYYQMFAEKKRLLKIFRKRIDAFYAPTITPLRQHKLFKFLTFIKNRLKSFLNESDTVI